MRERADELDAAGAIAVAVGFSPVDALGALAEHLAWPYPFLSDPDRLVFDRLGFPVVGRRQIWTPGTKQLYRDAADAGVEGARPVEDTNQLGGDAVVGSGVALDLYRTDSPDDRVAVDDLFASIERHRRPDRD